MDQPVSDPPVLRLCRWILRVARRIVPRPVREQWSREWEAEVVHHWNTIHQRRDRRWQRQAALVRQSSGAFADAAFLRQQFTADLDIVQDARYAVRMLRKRPLVSGLAIVVLALGLGGTITVFSTIDALLLRELPYSDSDRVVTVWQNDVTRLDERLGVASAVFRDYRERATSFESLAGAEPWSFDYFEGPEPVQLPAGLVTQGFFETLGVRPARGRLFHPEEYADGRSDVVLLSHAAWQRRFGGDEALVGGTIRLEGRPFLVAGVLPPSLRLDLLRRQNETAGVQSAQVEEVYAPRVFREFDVQNRRVRSLSVVGRLSPGVSFDQAQTDLATISRQLATEHSQTMATMTAVMVPLRDHIAGPLREPLALLLAAVVVVLLIACANIASLLIARGVERHREFAVRVAIGARRWRLVRQVMVEASVLAAIACGLGLMIAFVAIRAFVGFTSRFVPHLAEVTLDTRLIVCAFALAALSALLVGLWPAIKLSREGVQDGLKETATGLTASARHQRLASALIAGEVALAVVLLTAAGLLIRSFTTLVGVDPGFARSNIALLQVFAYGQRYPDDAKRLAFFRQMVESFNGQPGVVRVGLVSAMPFMRSDIDVRGGYSVAGRPVPAAGPPPITSLTVATPEYFDALRVPLQSGRLFSDRDHENAPRVAIINDLMAERAWPGEDPVGQRITVTWERQKQPMEIVGVVGGVRHNGLESDPRPEVFMPLAQVPFGSMTFVVQTSAEPAAVISPLKTRIWDVDPTLVVYDAATLDDLVSQSLAPRRFVMRIVSSLSSLAFLLAAFGIYGILSFSTAQRTAEIGLRRAMGASTNNIVRMVMREGMMPAVTGVVIGLAAALAMRRGIAALLYGVSPADPLTLTGTTALLLVVALIACYMPARRATTVDPLAALRAQ
jgi:putative ABC transport system permease protein